MKILVTGGAGYLGSILVETLLWEDHEVTVLDTFAHRQNSLAHLCWEDRLEIVRGDTRDVNIVKKLVAKADMIFPLAALVGAPLCDRDPEAAIGINTAAIRTICSLASHEQGIIIPITNSGYGIGEKGKECTELSPLKPVSLYGKSKVAAEDAVMDRGNAVSLRFATLFGMSPRMRLDLLVNDFVHRALRDRSIVLFEADAKRNYLHVRDAAESFVHALNNWGLMKENIYNAGLSEANLSKRELCEEIKKHIPSFTILEAKIGEDPDKRDYIVSNVKIEATGWKPQYSLDDGIEELVKGSQMIRDGRYANI